MHAGKQRGARGRALRGRTIPGPLAKIGHAHRRERLRGRDGLPPRRHVVVGGLGKGANSELHLWFAEALEGPWTVHPGNPVKIDVRSARPAGSPFYIDGVLYRPAQDCSSTYGARVMINRVLELTRTGFREEVAAAVNPDPKGKYPAGLHTLSAMGERTLVDGKRSVFSAAEFFRVLAHYLR
jgi:hypothetical protein